VCVCVCVCVVQEYPGNTLLSVMGTKMVKYEIFVLVGIFWPL